VAPREGYRVPLRRAEVVTLPLSPSAAAQRAKEITVSDDLFAPRRISALFADLLRDGVARAALELDS
jgi:hypothetical protein